CVSSLLEKKYFSRDSNFELLRIIAMLMIVGSHLAFHGIWRSQQNDAFVIYHMGSQINQWINSFLCVGGQTGVAIFFIITGYYQINRNFNLKSIKNIYYQCVFYSLLSLVIYLMILPWGGMESQF
ncbi:acyltransferase family protein, partial [Enterobacter hormaechei]|uniref:acyltransferase family protein n=3 Tax=Bacteria TaxID=2 RepID=UPI0037702759